MIDMMNEFASRTGTTFDASTVKGKRPPAKREAQDKLSSPFAMVQIFEDAINSKFPLGSSRKRPLGA